MGHEAELWACATGWGQNTNSKISPQQPTAPESSRPSAWHSASYCTLCLPRDQSGALMANTGLTWLCAGRAPFCRRHRRCITWSPPTPWTELRYCPK